MLLSWIISGCFLPYEVEIPPMLVTVGGNSNQQQKILFIRTTNERL